MPHTYSPPILQAPAPQLTGPVLIPGSGVDLSPPSYLVMSLVVTIISFFLNITSLIFGIPAIVLSVLVSVSLYMSFSAHMHRIHCVM